MANGGMEESGSIHSQP